jgi:hypothetical protein
MALALVYFGRRLGSFREAPLALVFFEGHQHILSGDRVVG